MWLLLSSFASAGLGEPVPGESRELPISEVRGIAWADGEILALDAGRRSIRRLRLEEGSLSPVAERPLPKIRDPRGLVREVEDGREVLYLLAAGPTLVRIDGESVQKAPLAGLSGREVYSLARSDGSWFVTWDPGPDGHYGGLARYDGDWSAVAAGQSPVMLPAAGRVRQSDGREQIVPTTAAALVPLAGEPYLVLVAGDSAYLAHVPTGRGVSIWPWERAAGPVSALTAGEGVLWAVLGVDGPDRLVAIDITSDPGAAEYGPWQMRDVTLSIRLQSKQSGPAQGGYVRHAYALPAELPTQHLLAYDPGATTAGVPLVEVLYGPADDPAMRATALVARWSLRGPGHPSYESSVRSRLLWRSSRETVLPHLASDEGLPAPSYLADDLLYGLDRTEIFDRLLDRVVQYVASTYHMAEEDVRSELGNPYWAARDTTEYILATHWYPTEEIEAPSDPERGIFPTNPAWAKALQSEGPRDGDEILMCSSAGMLLDAAMRRLGHGTRWLGAVFGTREEAASPGEDSRWDRDGNGLLQPGERQKGKNGHRWSEVWLGPVYGFVAFDATPKVDVTAVGAKIPPPAPTQWTLMGECAPESERKIVTTLGSGTVEPFLIRRRGSDPDGEQRYNLLGSSSLPKHFRSPEHLVTLENPLALDVRASMVGSEIEVAWSLVGPWSDLPSPTVSIRLSSGERRLDLARGVPVSQGSLRARSPRGLVTGERVSVIVTLDGDPLTGGAATVR